MSWRDFQNDKKKKIKANNTTDSSITPEITKQAQANKPIGPRQALKSEEPQMSMAQKMIYKAGEFLSRTSGIPQLRERMSQTNKAVEKMNNAGLFRKVGDTFQGGFNKAFGNRTTPWGTSVEKRDKNEVIKPSFEYKGNINLNSLPIVQNEDGSQSTVLSFSIKDEKDGKETVIPQVINGKIVSKDEAIKHYYETGKHLGKFDTIKEANKYAEKLHEEEEKRISEIKSKANPLLYKTTIEKENKQKEEEKKKFTQNIEARLPNGLVQQEQKDTWGQVLEKIVQNIQESNLEDTLNYSPKIVAAVGLGAKQGLEKAGQYYYETLPSHVDQGRWGEGISQMERNREIAREQLIKEKGIRVINTEEYQHAGDSLFQQWSRDDQEKINKIIEEAPNYVSKKLAEQAPSFGNSTLGGAANIVSPIASIGYFFGSSGQSYYEEALERGMDDEDSYLYSGIMATWESASDTAITAQNVNFLKSKITGKGISGNTMKLIGNQFVENAVQEAVTEPFQELMVGITGGKEYMQTSDLVPRMLDSGFWGGIQGALSGGLTGITANTFNNAQEATSYLRDKIQQQIEKNGKEKFAQDFIKGAQDTMSKSAKRMAEMSIDSSQLTEKQKTDIMRMINKPSSNLEQIKNAIQITQAWNEAVEGAYKNYRGKISDTSWKANVKNKAKEIERLSQTSNQNQNVSLKNIDENIKNIALGVAEERAKEQLEKNGQFKKRGNLTLGNYTINYTINENGKAKITKVTENVETQEIRPSTMENKPLSENKQQAIQEEAKTPENATSQETEVKALPKGKKKSKLLNIKSSENITLQEIEQNIKNYLENNEILSEEDLEEKIKTEKDAKELERLQGLKDKIAEMRNSVAENNTIKETSKQNQRKSEILETIGKTEEEWNKMSQYGKERTLDNFSLDEITDEDRSLMLEENVVNNEKIEKIEETPKAEKTQANNSNQIEESEEVDENLKEIRENSISNINERKRSLLLSNLENPNASKKFKKATKRSLQKDIGSYIVQTNQRTIRKARENIANNDNGFDDAYTTFNTKVKNNEKISLDDMAQGLLMMQHYDYIGDTKKAQKILENMAIVATESGQMIQILSLVKKVMPQARTDIARKVVERYNKKYDTNIKINEELLQKLAKEKDVEKADEIFSEVLEDAINQTPLTWGERFDNWRFMAMLTNLKTWGKNSLGNTVNRQVYKIKNLTKGVLEDLTGIGIKGTQKIIEKATGKESKFNYTKDISFVKIPTKSQKDFARMEAERLGSQIDTSGSKYSNTPEGQMKSLKRKFDTKILNDIANFTENVLESGIGKGKIISGDTQALMKMYSNALAHYMATNNLTREDFEAREGDSEKVRLQKEAALARASEYATWQAKEAAYHQANALASWLNNLDRMTEITGNERVDASIRAGGTLVKGLLPFRRTPFNMAAQSINFSPVGILRGSFGFAHDVIKDGNKLKQELQNGKITQEEFDMELSKKINFRLDQISKGVTGTVTEGIIGYALAALGIISVGNLDDDDKYEEQLGKQQYSLNILGHSFSLDFLAPAITPLFYGAEFYNALQEDPEASWFTTAGTAGRRSMNVLYNTTMLSSINNAFKYSDSIDDAIGTAISSYLSQFVPSMFTNIANTISPTRKDMAAQNQGIVGDFEYGRNKIANLLPFEAGDTFEDVPILGKVIKGRKDLPDKITGYGEIAEQNGLESLLVDLGVPESEALGYVSRAVENFILPTNIKEIKTDSTTDELLRLHRETDAKNILKTSGEAPKDFTFNKTDYKIKGKDKARAKEIYGKSIKENLDALFNSKAYKDIKDDEIRVEMVNDIYEAAREEVKADYLKRHGLPFASTSDIYNSLEAIKKAGGKQSDYYEYLTGTQGKTTAEKITYLNDMKLSDKLKKAIYENDTATYESHSSGTDEHYLALKTITNNKVSSDYLDYVEKSKNDYFHDEKDSNGKKIKGKGKKDKVRDFVNNSNMSNIEKYYIYVKEDYASSLSKTQRDELKEYLDRNKNNIDEKTYNSMIKKINEANK